MEDALALAASNYPSTDALVRDAQAAAVDAIIAQRGGITWTPDAYAELRATVRDQLEDQTHQILLQAANIIRQARSLDNALGRDQAPKPGKPAPTRTNPPHPKTNPQVSTVQEARDDIGEHMDQLLAPGFLTRAGTSRLRDLLRYIAAGAYRLERLGAKATQDAQAMAALRSVQAQYQEALATIPPGEPVPAALREIGWMIEELRVSLFAQPLGTAFPVSPKRIAKAIAAATDPHAAT
jgi:ATP-dependent helicase HrpA